MTYVEYSTNVGRRLVVLVDVRKNERGLENIMV